MARLARLADSRLLIPVRLLGLTALAFVAVGVFLLLFGKNPLAAYRAIFAGAFGSTYGLSEVVVRAIRPGISTGFGYTGFLVSWLALHHPLGIVAMAVLLGVLSWCAGSRAGTSWRSQALARRARGGQAGQGPASTPPTSTSCCGTARSRTW